MNTALLVIDVQQGLCEGEHAPFESPQVIDRINRVSDKARAAGAFVIFVQHESGSGYLEHGTPAWQLADGLTVAPTDLRIRKTSADSFHKTDLQAVLKAHDVEDLIVCGMHTGFASTRPPGARWPWATRWCWCPTHTRPKAMPACRRNKSSGTTTTPSPTSAASGRS